MGFARSAGRVYGQARKTWRKPKPKEREYSAQDFSGKDNLVNLRARKNDRTYELLVDDKDVYVAYDDQTQGKTRYKKAMSVGGFTSINPGKPGPQKQWAKTYQGSGGEYHGFDAVAKHLKDTGYDFQVLDKRPMKMRERTRQGDMPDIFGEYIDPRRAHNTSESYYRDSNFKSYRPESLDEKIEIVKKWRKEQKNPKKPKMADVPDDSAKQTTQDSQPGVNPNGVKTKARPWRHPSDQNPGPGWEGEVIDVVAEEPIRKNTVGGPSDVNSIAYQNAMKALNGPRKAIGYSGNPDKNTGSQIEKKKSRKFKTEKGSTYEIHDDATTTRNKAARPEHPGDFGIKDRSLKTIYVSPNIAQDIGMWNSAQNARGRRIKLENGKLVRISKSGNSDKYGRDKFIEDPVYKTEPEVGLHPVEFWDESGSMPGFYKSNHPGSRITSIDDIEASQPETYTPNWQAKLGKPKSSQSGRKAWRKKAEQQIKQARAEQQLTDSQQKTAGEPLQLGYTPSGKRLTNLSEQDKEMASLFESLGMPAHGGQDQKNLATDNKMWKKRVKNIGKSLVASAESGEPLSSAIDDQAIKDVESYFGRILDKHAVNDPEFENPTEKVKYAQRVLSVVNRNTTQAAIGNTPKNVVNDITVYQGNKVRGEGKTEGQVRLEGLNALINGLKSQATQEKDISVIEALLNKAGDLEGQQRQLQLSRDMNTGEVEYSPLTISDNLNRRDPQQIIPQSREYPDLDLENIDIGEATDLSVDPLAEIDARAAQGRQKIFTSTDINPVDPKTIDAYNVMSGQFATNQENVAFPARTMQLPSPYENPLGGLGDRYEQLSNRSDEQQFKNFLSGKGPKPGRFHYNVGQPELQPEGDYTPEQKFANQVAARIAGVAGEARSRKMIQEGYRLGLEQGDNNSYVFNEGVLNKKLEGSTRDISKQESKAFDDIYQSVMNHLESNPELMQNIAGLPPKQQEAVSRQLIGDLVYQILNESANSTVENIKRSQILSGTTNATSEDIQNASGNFRSKYLSNLLKKDEHASSIVGELLQRIDEAKANGDLVLDAIDRRFNGDPAAQNIAQANSDFAESTDDLNQRFAEALIQKDPQSLDAQNLASVLGINITPQEQPPEELSTAEIEMDLDPAILNDVTGMSEIYVVELPDDIDSELYSDGLVGAANDINYVVSKNKDTGVVTRDRVAYNNFGKNSIVVRNGAEFVITDANDLSDQKIVRLDSQPDLFQKLVSLTGVSTRVKNPVTYTDGPTHEANVTGEELKNEVLNNQAPEKEVIIKQGLSLRRNRPQS